MGQENLGCVLLKGFETFDVELFWVSKSFVLSACEIMWALNLERSFHWVFKSHASKTFFGLLYEPHNVCFELLYNKLPTSLVSNTFFLRLVHKLTIFYHIYVYVYIIFVSFRFEFKMIYVCPMSYAQHP